jgi:hypothetical protein
MNDTSRAYFSIFDILSVAHNLGSETQVAADECAMWFCIHAYNISVTDGRQNQSQIGNWSMTRLDYVSSSHGTEYLFIDIPDDFNVVSGVRYAVTREAMAALRNFMSSLTFGTVTNDANMIDYSSDWIEAMWNATYDLPGWMMTFTQSMTKEVREQGATRDTRPGAYDGSAQQLAPFIKVQWMWMVYPGILITASLYFLLHTIMVGARDGVSVWKSDALPMLFCRIDTNIHERVKNGMNVPDGLDERVGRTRVALYRGERGEWAFKTVEDND